ncbi:feruloyl esterase-like protein [Fomitopsis betulina]|nr:feruloyl esterase-like protein [Fomitopsis betulina]
MVRVSPALSSLLFLASVVLADGASSSKCASFTLSGNTNATVTNTTYYPKGTRVKLSTSMSSLDAEDLQDFCRVELTVITNAIANSAAHTEVWLPDSWNNRFLTFGNGGFAGGINVGELGLIAVNQSYAGVSTDQGHTSKVTSAQWAGPGDDNAIVDWGWRAMHLSVVVGKEVVKQYYGSAQNKSYYMGCSQGDTQQVIGSPAAWHSHLRMWAGYLNSLVEPNTSDRYISENLWKNVIHKEVLNQCDDIDGLTDGIINDPRLCILNTSVLLCQSGQDASSCLTKTQVDTLEKIYSDYVVDNDWVFGQYYPGGEDAYATGYVEKPSAISQSWFRYMLLNDTKWSLGDYNSSLIALGDKINPGQSDATDSDLSVFAQQGGKLLHYVGWADEIISPGGSIHYYDSVKNFMSSGGTNIDDFYRLFTVPGMEHCYGGDGANAFGAVQQASNDMPPLNHDPQYDVLAAMVQWVESGIAPSSLIAVHYQNNTVAGGIDAIRPLCQYPKSLYYTGGDELDPTSYTCELTD